MSYFSPQTEVLELGDGNTVQLRKLTYAEMTDVYSDPANADKTHVLIAEKSLKAWHGPGFEERPATVDNLQALPADVALKIIQFAVDINSLSKKEGEASGVATS